MEDSSRLSGVLDLPFSLRVESSLRGGVGRVA